MPVDYNVLPSGTRYVLLLGGVLSGIGKGTVASSLGRLLRQRGMSVTAVKIDPYLNVDAGTMSPFEHGEVFVLGDGSEVDLDMGNYERFLGVELTSANVMTTGRIYHRVIARERAGGYLGKTVQVVPHITDEIQTALIDVAARPQTPPEVVLVELGGTVGDIESAPFIEALRQLRFRLGAGRFFVLLVSLVPTLGASGEHKTKPTQHAVQALRQTGLVPDGIVCRSQRQLSAEVADKVAMMCHVARSAVFSLHDVGCIYEICAMLEAQGIVDEVLRQLGLGDSRAHGGAPALPRWDALTSLIAALRTQPPLRVVSVGKYTEQRDAYLSLAHAIDHAAYRARRHVVMDLVEASDLEDSGRDGPAWSAAWRAVRTADAIIVPGGFGSRGYEGKILAIEHARTTGTPMLGVCLGLQLAVIEYARHVLGIAGATSEEFLDEIAAAQPSARRHQNADVATFAGPAGMAGAPAGGSGDEMARLDLLPPPLLVMQMPDVSKAATGASMRLGHQNTRFTDPNSLVYRLYARAEPSRLAHVPGDAPATPTLLRERHRHRFEINPKYVPQLVTAGLRSVARDLETGARQQILELDTGTHPYFVGTQFHPEFQSRPDTAHPIYLGLVLAAAGHLERFLDGSEEY